MPEVLKLTTPLTETGLAVAVYEGHLRACGGPPSLARWSCLWAQLALEHARGKAIWCENFGNATASAKWPGDYYVLDCAERVSRNPDAWKVLRLRFCAFDAAPAGAQHYVELLAGRYARALALMDHGDAAGAALVLSELNYYTADEHQYSAAMSSLAKYALTSLLPPLMSSDSPATECTTPDCDGDMRSVLTADEVERAMGAVVLDLRRLSSDAIDEAESDAARADR